MFLDIESCNDINATAPSIPKTDYQNSDDYKSSWNTSRDICLVLSFMSFLGTRVYKSTYKNSNLFYYWTLCELIW